MDAVLVNGGQDEDQKIFIPRVPRMVDVAVEEQQQQQQQQRGLKRSRRDRGSTAKERISKMPPCAAGKRSSIYRGVTRHRWTGRYEAHLWDKSTWNQSQNKKGKQVYLGAYDEEEAAARAYDLAALKYWGPGTLINFPLSDYARDVDEMQSISREEYLASLRRKSSGFSRGVSKYRGVTRHQLHGRWEARIGRVLGNKYMCVGSYHPQDETSTAYDMAALDYRSSQAVTQIDLSSCIRWLRPGIATASALSESDVSLSRFSEERQLSQDENSEPTETYQLRSLGLGPLTTQKRSSSSPPALSLLLQSPLFNEMLERASTSECDSMSTERSEVSHRMEQQQPQQIDNEYYSNGATTWGTNQQVAAEHHQPLPSSQLQAPPSPLEDERSVYHSGHEESTSYHRSVTSNYNYEGLVERHPFADLALEDIKPPPPPYMDVCHQQQQHDDHLAALAYDHHHHGGYVHGSVTDLYQEPGSGVAPSLDDGAWGLSGVVPLSNIVNTCGGHDGGLRSRLLPWLGGRVIQ